MSKIVTFGEILLRLSPSGYKRFIQTDNFEVTFGGSESNVAVNLACLGLQADFVSKLPDDGIGQSAVNFLRRYGVGVDYVIRGGNRTGIYYFEKGFSQRAGKVIYDRAGSSIAAAAAEEFDWDKIFADADWFHFSGITPALGDSLASACLNACRKAKEKGMTVSCDINYRSKLWNIEKAARVISGLAKYADILIASEDQAEKIFNLKADVVADRTENCKNIAERLVKKFGFKYVAITIRESFSADENNWQALLYDGSEFALSKKYSINIVDRVGGGDAFDAGLIYALKRQFPLRKAVDFAIADGCLKHSIEGDVNTVTADEVECVITDGSGRISR